MGAALAPGCALLGGALAGAGHAVGERDFSTVMGPEDPKRRRIGEMPTGCDCARVVLGKIYPNQCRLFGAACTPRTPIGPCMVSGEGACRIWWAGGVRERRGS